MAVPRVAERDNAAEAMSAGGVSSPRGTLTAASTGAANGVPVMTGTHFHALDEKGRVIIPAKLRSALADQFWMMLDENDNIGIYNHRTGLDVLEYCEQMIARDPDNEDIAAAVERITGSAELMPVDGNWRVQVPEILRFYAELDKEVVTVGVLNHAVMWSRDKWENAQARRLQSVEVRRAQAGMLRAAASSIRKAAPENENGGATSAVEESQSSGLSALGRGGNSGSAGNSHSERAEAPATGNAAVASTGNGGRSARVLTLSRLGR